MSLDDKLKELLHLAGYGSDMVYETDDALVAQIKQAFADEGYVPLHQLKIPEGTRKVTITYEGERGVTHKKDFLNGQEWYDKFMSEWDKSGVFLKPDETGDLIEAAKKAAGLDTNQSNRGKLND